LAAGAGRNAVAGIKGRMSEKFDLQKMLLEIRDDEAIDIAKAKHLSQLQIQELVTRRKAKAAKQETKPTDAR
jgi:hypothetical protein